jgi:hypothetical protein
MPIYQAFQMAQAAAQCDTFRADVRHGSDQLISRAHLMHSLRREQAEIRASLRVQHSIDLVFGVVSGLPPFVFRTFKGQIARLVARLLR